MLVLTVIHPFDDYKRGSRIADADTIKEVLASENAHHCVKSNSDAPEHHED
jgi:hypothetical protein